MGDVPAKKLFVSYARSDIDQVRVITDAVSFELASRALDVHLWLDISDLAPGQSWEAEITRALESSIGLLVFVSPAAMKSEWVSREVLAASHSANRLIIPVILRHVPDLPKELAERQWIDLSGSTLVERIHAAKRIADAVDSYLETPVQHAPIAAAEAPQIASEIADRARHKGARAKKKGIPPKSVFLVHGHDHDALRDVQAFLSALGIRSTVLSSLGGASQSLLQKFLASATDAQFAVVILSADDFGASRVQYEAHGVADRALQFRARQNVVLELGFFYGLLGWENVFVVLRTPDLVFPNFERPSDLDGAVFDIMDSTGGWRAALTNRLKDAGFKLPV